MKCPNCGREVEKGNLFCTHCLAEIPWVQEYNTVETLMEKKKMEEPEDVPEKKKLTRIEEAKEYLKIQFKEYFNIKVLAGLVLCVLLLAWGIRGIYLRTSPAEKLYGIAREAFIEGNYDKAMEYTERTLEKDSSYIQAEMLTARIMEVEGDRESAITIMELVVKENPDHADAYYLYIRLLTEEGRTAEVKEILDNCYNKEILEACSEYICAQPASNQEEGTYGEVREVILSSEEGNRIFYTLDGSEPTIYSTPYTSAIVLEEGTTTLNAICVNDKNISSDILKKVYVISTRNPDSPQVIPEDGNYYTKTKIEVTVPEGYRAFYAFGEIPTVASTEYFSPITMPEGYQTLYVILVSENGKISEPTVRTYYLEY